MTQLHIENRCLKSVESAVDAFDQVIALSAVPRKQCGKFSDIFSIRDNTAGIAHGAKIFSWIERKSTDVANRSDESALVSGEVSLCAVFDNPEAVSLCYCENG